MRTERQGFPGIVKFEYRLPAAGGYQGNPLGGCFPDRKQPLFTVYLYDRLVLEQSDNDDIIEGRGGRNKCEENKCTCDFF